jgi:hypothetical protein
MDFAICLDQFSTNFNVSSLSPNGFSIYTDLDYTNPIASGIPYQDLFAPPIGNCPLIVDIPQGATQILVIDACATLPTNVAPIFGAGSSANSLITQCCYAIIPVPVEPISFCDTCNLEFDVFSSSYVGQIVAGNLTSTCGTVTDYKIGWYLDGDYSAPVFTSGYGTAFLPYQQTHPLTGNSAVPAVAGDWEGIIHDIAINGTTYSSVSGSANGTPIPFESCFDTIVVEPLECDNGTFAAKYSHQITFNSQAAGATSAPVSLTYALEPTTKYFAYLFDSFSVWDEIEIKWKSGNPAATTNPTLFAQPIYLEKLKRGSDLPGIPFPFDEITTPYLPQTPTQQFNSVWPKISSTSVVSFPYNYGFQRVLTLTNLPTSSNPSFPDLLEITITPNPTNNNTQWKAGFQCLEDFDCADCNFDNWPDSLPKISSILLEKQYGCDAQRLVLSISGCLPNSDLFSQENPLTSFNGNLVGSWTTFPSPKYFPSWGGYIPLTPSVDCTWSPNQPVLCGPSSTGTITLNKIPNQIQLTFNLYSDYLHYKNSLLNTFNTLSTTNGLNLTSPVSCPAGSTSLDYYRFFRLNIPIQPSPTANCGDNTVLKEYFFHFNDYFNITYTNDNNPSATSWSITIPQSAMVNCYPIVACNTCDSVAALVTNMYNSPGGQLESFSFTTTVGAKYTNSFTSTQMYTLNLGNSISGSICYTGGVADEGIPWYSFTTIPFIQSTTSPTGWVNLPTLGGSPPCNLIPYSSSWGVFDNSGWFYRAFLSSYQVRFPNLTSSFDYSLSTNDFEIYSYSGFGNTGSSNLSLFQTPPCPDPLGTKIYSYSASIATVHTASYFVGGNPTLIINP